MSIPRLSSALALAGALVALPALAAGTSQSPARAKPSASQEKAAQVVELAVTGKGFEPAAVRVKAGRPVKLVVTRRTERTCATEIVVKDYGVNQPLPLNQPVEVTFTPKKAGPV